MNTRTSRTTGTGVARGAGPLTGRVRRAQGSERIVAALPLALAGDLVDALRRLKLATVREQAALLQTARTQRWEPEEVLRALLQAEIAARDVANRRMRLKQAGFPVL